MQATPSEPVTEPAPVPTAVIAIGLVLMSLGSGCMEVLSYRFLGSVFTSAMTGNVALMGLEFGAGRFPGAWHNLAAFAAFLFGLLVAALLVHRPAVRPALMQGLAAELVLLVVFAVSWRVRGSEADLFWLIAVSATAMGMQSATAQKMDVPWVSTTYFTGTITGIVFGLVRPTPATPASWSPALWPVTAFASYILGAFITSWTTAGQQAHELSPFLPAAPAAAVVTFLLLLAFVRRRPAH